MRYADVRGAVWCMLLVVTGCAGAPGEGGEGSEQEQETGRATSADGGGGSAAEAGNGWDSAQVVLPASQRGPELAGTLTFPTRGCPCPTVVLLQGAGSHDRDYTLFGHKPFALLAGHLARNGVATLRYDERGVGESGGHPGRASPQEMTGDVLGWTALLEGDPRVDRDHIGLLGHSEGGIVASLVGARAPELAFLILLGTPGLPGLEYNLQYEASVGRSMGLDDGAIDAKARFQARVLGVLMEAEDSSTTEARLRSLYGELTPPPSPERIDRAIAHLVSPEFMFNLRFDPGKALAGIRIPVLAVFGGKDVQVPPERNAEAMRDALDTGSGRDRVVVLPGLNHFMQTAETGAPPEYPLIQETLAPEVMDLILRWIRTHSGPRAVGSCTVMLASDGQTVLGAANEDWQDPLSRFWIIPEEGGKHGWIKFGFAAGFPQAGMNDEGLFWDATGSPYLEMPRSEATKTLHDGPLMVKVMEEAGGVEEAREIFEAFYCEDQYRAQYLVGDARGNSMIVEGDSILLKEGSFQVLTNFYHSRPDLGGYPCGRYEKATQMLGAADAVTPFLLGSVLDATHQNGSYPTQYSVIYDLPSRRVHVFHYHNFHEYLTLDLEEELAKGARDYDIPPLFSQVRLLSPGFQSSVTGPEVELRWEGKLASQYRLCISTSGNPGPSCPAIQPRVALAGTEDATLPAAASLLLLLAAVPAWITRRRAGLALLLLALVAAGACGSGPAGPTGDADAEARGEMSYTVTSLQPATTYYWRLAATAPGITEFSTETETFSFTTTE